MTLAFAQAYEKVATRITAPISVAALARVGTVDRSTRLLDIAAGSGAFSVPAAHAGAAVTAIDIAPGMVDLLTERLAPFPKAEVWHMDGQKLAFEDQSFDAAVSILGTLFFDDWQRGLSEQARILKSGGTAVVATWRTPPGGGPFVIMAEALRRAFPDRPSPMPPAGFTALADPERLAGAMHEAGLVSVAVETLGFVWEGPAGDAYLDELSELHPFMGPYAAADVATRARLDSAILAIVDEIAVDGRVELTAPVLLATGVKP
ncbi:class I SAM-dependent methyltransferase [Pseudomonas matsuisoli]|uniref:Methyltransferase type 11 domain-containing protein n=1 Tax=Pseudomonas matsuisoli TaxID=1515666 RepID=A0A917PUI2_9PSED|nr:class I SAM-dependent methyltransferase [Pseudomonas matsuisoli]GGJ92006.1 hypothetical protein GCM10009304_17230 [Pseudomonas matsuisoli]